MRLVALVLLLLSGVAWSATETQFCSASVASPYATATDECGSTDAKDCCPSNLSNENSGANLTSTAFDGDVTTTVDEGTMYACARTSATSVRTCAQIQAGTGCADTSSKAVSAAGLVDFSGGDNFSGLSASTEYVIDYCHPYDSRPLDEVVSTAPVTTLAGGGAGGADLTGTGYFVSADGNDSNDGLSVANAWLTIAKVNNSVTALGSNVYFETGDTWTNERLTVDWSGEAGDVATIQTYCIDTSDGNKPKAWTSGGTGCGARALLQYTSNTANAAITLSGVDYVTINAIDIDGVDTPNGTAGQTPPQNIDHWLSTEDTTTTNITIQNSTWTRAAGFNCIEVEGNSSDWVIDNMTLSLCGNLKGNPVDATFHQRGDGINLRSGTSNITITDSTISTSGHNAIQAFGTGHYIARNTLDGSWESIFGADAGYRVAGFNSTNSVVELNEIKNGGCTITGSSVGQAAGIKLGADDQIFRFNRIHRPDFTASSQNDCNNAIVVTSTTSDAGFRQMSDQAVYGNWISGGWNDGYVNTATTGSSRPTARAARNRWKNNRFDATNNERVAVFTLDNRDDTGDPFDGNQWIDNCLVDTDPDWRDFANGVGIIDLTGATPSVEADYSANASANQVNQACTTDGQGSDLATTTDSGTGSNPTVDDGRFFAVGDVLDINGDVCTLSAVNRSTGALTCDESFTWASSEAVNLGCDTTPGHGSNLNGTCGTPGDPD